MSTEKQHFNDQYYVVTQRDHKKIRRDVSQKFYFDKVGTEREKEAKEKAFLWRDLVGGQVEQRLDL